MPLGSRHTPPSVPIKVVEVDTGRVSKVIHEEMVAANPGGMGDDDVLELLANKLAPKLNSGGGGGGGHFLGMSRDSWAKMILAWVVAAGLAIGAWHLAVRDALQARPTTDQVKQETRSTFETHNDSSKAHPPIQLRLDKLSGEQRTIRESQIRQEEIDKSQTELLQGIRVDITRIRRNQ